MWWTASEGCGRALPGEGGAAGAGGVGKQSTLPSPAAPKGLKAFHTLSCPSLLRCGWM